MSLDYEGTGARANWFVGATYVQDDQTLRFLQEGIWENGWYPDDYIDVVKSVQVGDRIAIKSAYTRKLELPFDNQGRFVSAMKIKAIGTVKENPGDGRTLMVDWEPINPPREWYFQPIRITIWQVLPDSWQNEALVDFTFEGKPQDINRFRNSPSFRDRFGDASKSDERFKWTSFYEAIADKILTFKDKREILISGIHEITSRVDSLSNFNDKYSDGTSGPLKDICPFTVMGIFNRNNTNANRKIIATELAKLLGVSEPVPEFSQKGIPTLMSQNTWFFFYDDKRQDDDIDVLWELFCQALIFAESDDERSRLDFIVAYDDAIRRGNTGWNLTMGLYWIRPWIFPTLDTTSRNYIKEKLKIKIHQNGPNRDYPSASDYLDVADTLNSHFQQDDYPVHSFPEITLEYWNTTSDRTTADSSAAELISEDDRADSVLETEVTAAPVEPYTVDNILDDGCFIDRSGIEKILERLRAKKNLILQGPPGTGKTWLSKRLAFALIGQRDDSKIRAVQFHPTLSYEDFVRGWRPSGNSGLELVDGPFIEMINKAKSDPTSTHVFVIEEINRGNPAQIFGEMLTLLGSNKRNPQDALELTYKHSDNERIFIPKNFYLIGTMNIADRSLALVDLALRRRFVFISLEPTLNDSWSKWVELQCGVNSEILVEIRKRLSDLNNEISNDTNLGPQFCVGHSYVTPSSDDLIEDARGWFRDVVETEIGPQLDEYWFDALEKSKAAKKRLLEGF